MATPNHVNIQNLNGLWEIVSCNIHPRGFLHKNCQAALSGATIDGWLTGWGAVQ